MKNSHPARGVNFDITKDVAIESDGLGTSEVITRDDFYEMISDFHKELHGIRFRNFAELDVLNIQQVAEFYDNMFERNQLNQTKMESVMRISKKDLTKIIREEKEKLLVEMGPLPNAERSLGLYADAASVDQVTDSILDVLQQVEMGAHEDGMEDEEAEEYARSAAILAVANAFEAAGFMDIKYLLHKAIR